MLMNKNTLHYTLSGNPEANKCLLFIHGFACDEQDWKNQVKNFSSQYQIITCDLRGHGKSQVFNNQFDVISLASDVRNLIEALKIDKPLIVTGHSMGVRIVLELYSQISYSIHGLVLIDCGYDPIDNPHATLFQQQINTHGYKKAISDFFEQTFSLNSPKEVRDFVLKRVHYLPEKVGAVLFPNIQIYDYYATKKVLNIITVPALFLQATLKFAGKRYSIGTIDATNEWLELVKEYTPHAQIKIVPNSGHFAMLEQPEFINSAISDFLSTLP